MDVTKLGVVTSITTCKVLDVAICTPFKKEIDLLKVMPLYQDREGCFNFSINEVDVSASCKKFVC